MKSNFFVFLVSLFLAGCSNDFSYDSGDIVEPFFGSPVLTNETPYSSCLSNMAKVKADRFPVFSVGQVTDKTGQLSFSTFNDSTALTQGVSETG